LLLVGLVVSWMKVGPPDYIDFWELVGGLLAYISYGFVFYSLPLYVVYLSLKFLLYPSEMIKCCLYYVKKIRLFFKKFESYLTGDILFGFSFLFIFILGMIYNPGKAGEIVAAYLIPAYVAYKIYIYFEKRRDVVKEKVWSDWTNKGLLLYTGTAVAITMIIILYYSILG